MYYCNVKRKKRAMALAVSASVLVLGANAASADESFAIEDIVVTATKKSESLQDVSIAVSAFTDQMLIDSGVKGLKDIDGFIPNVRISNAGGVRNTPITIRGIVSDANGPGIEQAAGVYIDGVYMGRPTTINSPLYDLERVEVLRGPQGTLFGKNTVAGALNITTKLPTEEAEVEVVANLSNYNGYSLYGSVSGALTENVRSRFSATRQKRDGFLVNSQGPDNQDEDATAVRFTTVYDANDDLQVIFRADAARDRTQSGASQIFENGLPTQLLGYTNPADPSDRKIDDSPSSYQDRDVWGGSLEVNWNNDIGTITSITSVRGYEFDNQSSIAASPLDFGMAGIAEKQKQYSQEFRISADVGDAFTYTAGVYYFKQDLDANPEAFLGNDTNNLFSIYASLGLFNAQAGGLSVLDATSGPGQFIDADLNDESYAVFGQGTYNLTDDFSITAGLRYSSEKKEIRYYEFNQFISELLVDLGGGFVVPFPVPAVVDDTSDSFDDDALSGMLSFNYQMNDDVLLYASYSKGFKAGGYNAFNLVQSDGSIGKFDSESADSYEVGFKSMLMENRIRLNAAAYYLDYQDLQVNQLQPVAGSLPAFLTSNAASAKSVGVELELQALLTDDLELQFAYGYNDSEYKDYTNATPAGDDFSGNRMQKSPDESASMALQYSISLSDEWSLRSRAEVKYRSDYFQDPANTEELSQGGYSLTNIRVGFINQNNGMEVTFWGRNIFDKEYTTNKTYTDAALFPGHMTGRLGDPRTYGVEVRFVH